MLPGKKEQFGTVLIVDDDPGARLSMVSLLEEEFEVFVASNTHEAQTVLGIHPIDVVVADYQMPGKSGVELAEDCRDRFPGVIFLLITGFPELAEVKKARDNPNIFLVLRKTYKPSFIIDWIKKATYFAKTQQKHLKISKSMKKFL